MELKISSPLHNHTYCQIARKANTQAKTCQRVWLPQHTDRPRRIMHENLICISNGGGSSKYQGLWLASTSFRFDNEVFRIPPLLIHLTLLPMLNEHLRFNQGNCNILVK